MIWSGHGVEMEVRDETSDWNTVQACIAEDEYGLANIDMVGMKVFDVGAHVGSIGIWCARRGAISTCIEPVPGNLDLIWKNTVRNQLEAKVRLVPGVAGEPGERVVRWGAFHDENARHHAYIGDSSLASPAYLFESRIVRSYSLAELIDIYRGAPDIIKLDCEGGEWAWLQEPEIRDVPLIVGEWHPVDGHVQEDVEAALLGTHFITFTGPVDGPGGFRAEIR